MAEAVSTTSDRLAVNKRRRRNPEAGGGSSSSVKSKSVDNSRQKDESNIKDDSQPKEDSQPDAQSFTDENRDEAKQDNSNPAADSDGDLNSDSDSAGGDGSARRNDNSSDNSSGGNNGNGNNGSGNNGNNSGGGNLGGSNFGGSNNGSYGKNDAGNTGDGDGTNTDGNGGSDPNANNGGAGGSPADNNSGSNPVDPQQPASPNIVVVVPDLPLDQVLAQIPPFPAVNPNESVDQILVVLPSLTGLVDILNELVTTVANEVEVLLSLDNTPSVPFDVITDRLDGATIAIGDLLDGVGRPVRLPQAHLVRRLRGLVVRLNVVLLNVDESSRTKILIFMRETNVAIALLERRVDNLPDVNQLDQLALALRQLRQAVQALDGVNLPELGPTLAVLNDQLAAALANLDRASQTLRQLVEQAQLSAAQAVLLANYVVGKTLDGVADVPHAALREIVLLVDRSLVGVGRAT